MLEPGELLSTMDAKVWARTKALIARKTIGELLSTMDAKVWADEFMETKARLGEKEFDHAMMLGWFANAIMAGFDEATRRQQATIADLQGQLVEWKRALHSLTPGGSEYANDLKACVEWVREARSRQHETIIDGVRQRKDLQQRVAQLEGERESLLACQCDGCSERLEDNDAYCQKCWTTLQADHARVLGLVQETVKFFKSNFENAGLELCGLMGGKEITYTGQRLNELIEQLAASLPAQRAKLAQGGASKEAMT